MNIKYFCIVYSEKKVERKAQGVLQFQVAANP